MSSNPSSPNGNEAALDDSAQREGAHGASASFPKSHRLSGKLQFAAVYDAKMKVSKGPLVCYSRANHLGHLRLGLSVSRRVGTAPQRNRIKRLLREAFRLQSHPAPLSYDLIIVVRPHTAFTLTAYREIYAELLYRSHTLQLRQRIEGARQ